MPSVPTDVPASSGKRGSLRLDCQPRGRLRGRGCTVTRRFAALLVALLLPLAGEIIIPTDAVAARTRAASAPAQRERANDAAFWDALRRDDAARVQTFLLRGIDTNIVHPEYGPAIVAAARERAWNVVRTLAGIVGTRVDAANARGETAAMLAALRGNLDMVRLLVEKGAQLNRPGWTVLHYAAIDGDTGLLQYLLDQNAYIDAESPNRTTPLMLAARHENIDAVHLLVQAGADPTLRNEAGLDAAGYLASHGMTSEAQWMREQADAFARRYRPSAARPAQAAQPAGRTAADVREAKPAVAAERPAPDDTAAHARTPVQRPARTAAQTPADTPDRTTTPARLPGMRN